MPDPVRDLVFISYSHEDSKWLSDLLTFLKPYRRQGLEVWADEYIQVGDRWEREIGDALDRACVGVLLVSQDFIDSDFICEEELPPLMSAADSGELTLVCVPLSSFTYAVSGLDVYQWVRDPMSPLQALGDHERNTALVKIAHAIVEAAGKRGEQLPRAAASARLRGAVRPATRASEGPLGHLVGVPQQRPHHVPRSKELACIKALILDQGRQAVGITARREERTSRLAVQGRGGIGKTVLAIDLANDADVRRAFPDGVYWATLGQKPALQQLQADLLEEITGEPSPVENLQQGRERLTASLAERSALLVLDDVWQPAHARALDSIGPTGRLVLTTRDSSVVTATGAEELALDLLQPEAALELLAQWSGMARKDLPPEAGDLAEECGRLPLALALAGAQVRDGRSWADLLAALRDGRVDYLDHPYGSVFRSMQLSLDALTDDHRARLLELAVFPEDVTIPEATILRYWRHTGGLADYQSRALLHDLRNKGLLYLREKDDRLSVELHDLQRDFLLLLVDAPEPLHQALLEAHGAAYRQETGEWAWWQMPRDEPYLWDWLGLHLHEAGRSCEFRQLLLDYRWLRAKLRARSLNHLLSDFDGFSPLDPVGLAKASLELSAHVLARAPGQLPSQLLGRLIGIEKAEIRGLCESIRCAADEPWLAPRLPSLTRPGGALLRILKGHTEGVTAVSLTSDERRAVSASRDGTLKVWDLETGELLHDLRGHQGVVTAVSLTSDDRRAVSASRDGTLKVWDLEADQLQHDLRGHEGVDTAVSLTSDERRAVSGSHDGTLKVWDLETGELLHDLRGDVAWVTALSLTSDDRRAVSGSWDGTLKVWDLETGELQHDLRGHEVWVTALSLTSDERRAVSGSRDSTLKVWDLETGELLHDLRGHEDWVTALSLTSDDRRAVSGSEDGTLKVWDLQAGVLLHDLRGHEDRVSAISLTSDDRRAVSGSEDGTLKVWDLETGELLHDLRGHVAWVTALSLTSDDRRAVSGSDDGTLKVWDLEADELQHDLRGHEGVVTALSLTSDERRAVSASRDGTLKVWDLDTGELQHDLRCHEGVVTAVSLTSDDRRAVSASRDGGTLKVWDLETGELLHDLRGHEDWVSAVSLTSDDRRAVSGSHDGTLKVWDLETGELLHDLRGHEVWVTALSLTSDDRRAVSGSEDGTLKVWDLETGELQHDLRGHKVWVTALSLTSDDRRAVSASRDGGTLKVWDLETGELLHDLRGHEGVVIAVSLTSDDRRAVSGSEDGTLKVWDLETGDLLHDLRGHDVGVHAVSLTPDDRRAVSVSWDGTLKVWDMETGGLVVEYHADGAIFRATTTGDGEIIVAGDALGHVHILEPMGCDF